MENWTRICGTQHITLSLMNAGGISGNPQFVGPQAVGVNPPKFGRYQTFENDVASNLLPQAVREAVRHGDTLEFLKLGSSVDLCREEGLLPSSWKMAGLDLHCVALDAKLWQSTKCDDFLIVKYAVPNSLFPTAEESPMNFLFRPWLAVAACILRRVVLRCESLWFSVKGCAISFSSWIFVPCSQFTWLHALPCPQWCTAGRVNVCCLWYATGRAALSGKTSAAPATQHTLHYTKLKSTGKMPEKIDIFCF